MTQGPTYSDLAAAYKSLYITIRRVRDDLRKHPDESVTFEGSTNDLDEIDGHLEIINSIQFAELIYPLPKKQHDHMTDWQPISTAPKDGDVVLVYKPNEQRSGEYIIAAYWGEWPGDGYTWIACAGHALRSPTHWMPLPDPPKMELP